MQKYADAQHPIHDLLKARWSPRAYSKQAVETDKLLSLFEAARWSPSGGNTQPWAFIVVNAATEPGRHAEFVETLTGNNRAWAQNVPVLVLTVAKTATERGPNRWAYYDVGQAVAHLSIQAVDLGLHVHQMAGFDADKVRQLFAIPEGYEPVTVVAIGYQGNPDDLPVELRQRELIPRTRKPMTEFVFADRWNQALTIEADEDAVRL